MTKVWKIRLILLYILLITVSSAFSQRSYTSRSVLATGNWYKIAVKQPGVYKLDIAFLNKLGLTTSGISAESIRIFGNGGAMLPEQCNGPVIDDLAEISIQVEDGGDGMLNGTDYILFYAEGPHHWIKDSVNRTFRHQKNLYSEESYYYITTSGQGKRIPTLTATQNPNVSIINFQDRYFHETDTFNFLSSGKQWYGEEFASSPGKPLLREFRVNIPNIVSGQPGLVRTNLLSRAFGAASTFNAVINNNPVLQVQIPPVATGPYDQFAREESGIGQFTASQQYLNISFQYSPGSMNAQGWLDWFELFCTRELSLSGTSQLLFRDWNNVSPGNFGRFQIRNTDPSMQVWDITNPQDIVRMNISGQGSDYYFTNECGILHEYIAFTNSGFLNPLAVGRIPNQNLHNTEITDFLLVTHPALLSEAKRLANFHQQNDQLKTVVVTTDEIFNEFSSGIPDPAAIRDFVKMYYDRAGTDSANRPKYLLLLGDASFDYKDRIQNNTNLVPAFESFISLDPLSSYTSDDFFGFLDDTDDINGSAINLLDIGMGRIPAKSMIEAKAIVDKIIHYSGPKALGPWRNDLSFVADDEDANLHLEDAELITGTAATVAPEFNIEKIYLDAFHQESSAGGSRYPDANLTINNKIFSGTILWNYNGHGGYRRLAEEVVLDQEIINQFNNPDRLPLFITATCDFAPFDNPLVSSIGENLLLREKTGAIALMTTTRLVFAFSNRVMNNNYLAIALKRKPNQHYPSLGEAVKAAKNYTYQFFGDVINNRKFTLLGDPALTLSFPYYNIETTAINGTAVGTQSDTLKALSKYTISGVIKDTDGNTLEDFNGTIFPSLFDKVQTISTLANDPGSLKTEFQVQKNLLFKGKARVINGRFSFDFVVPKDIDYIYGKGRISYYGENGLKDGNGFSGIIIGGTGDSINDKEGPEIRAFLNDEKFVSGGITNENPVLLIKLSDSAGINIMGTGIGHDLVAMIDNDPDRQFILNEFYESELDDFRKGTVRFQLPEIEEGFHTLTIKAWDVANNSNQTSLDFRIIKSESLSLRNVVNYPNPFTTKTNFWFEHNRPGEELRVSVQIFTVTGKLVKTLRTTIISTGNRSFEVEWDGKDEYGSRIGRGVYIYNLKVQTSDGKTAQKLEKLFLL